MDMGWPWPDFERLLGIGLDLGLISKEVWPWGTKRLLPTPKAKRSPLRSAKSIQPIYTERLLPTPRRKIPYDQLNPFGQPVGLPATLAIS